MTGTQPTLARLTHVWRRAMLYIISIVLLATGLPIQTPVFSLGQDDRRSLYTPFYDPGGGLSSCSPYGGPGIVEGAENGEKIWSYLVTRGLSAEQSAGVMGNLYQESGYLPHKQEGFANTTEAESFSDDRGGWGLAQWTYGRRDVLRDTVEDELGSSYYTYQELPEEENDDLLILQLEFMYEEMQVRNAYAKDSELRERVRGMNEWEAILEMNTVEDALVLFHDSFERSADSPEEVINNRGSFAQAALADYGNIGPLASSGFCERFGGGDLQETALAYAWPDWRGSTYSTQKQEYSDAIAQAQDAGETWFGGCGGNDCGAFVTRIMRDSGFDEGYNPDNGNTTTQMEYLEAEWDDIGRGNEINTADLQPGDVAIRIKGGGRTYGHTFVYVGDIPDFDSQIASASVSGNCSNSRAPMAGRESLTDPAMTWFRKPQTGGDI